ncbi:myosin heavy chain, clone 203-like, partial [Physella acuta]|uniref:myosin heavy chain, clone 203-like n=1 Tax=Physella acuta TaxID=109671 RepID=UPI0027DD1D01
MRYGENPSDRLEHGADRPRSRLDRPLTLRERESERDRRARSASPPVHRDGPSMMWSAGVPDQSAELAELTTMRQALMKTRRDLTETERALIDTREMTEDAKSKLMVLEFNKGSALKEVDRLNDDIKRKQVQLTALDSELQNKLQELKNMASYGVTREDCMEVKNVKDENEALKVKLRNMEGLGLERDELVRQLDAAKEDLLREQKHIRLQEAELREEIENLTSKLEEVQNGWSKDQDQLGKLQQAYKRMEREKNELIQGKAREYEALKASYKEEVGESQMRMKKEVRDMETELKELRQRVTEMHADNISKESTIQNL